MTNVGTYGRRRLNLRRFLAMIILLAMIWLLVWVARFSGLLDPVIQTVKPLYLQVIELINDPLGIDWGDKLIAAAAVIVPPLVLLLFLFDDTSR